MSFKLGNINFNNVKIDRDTKIELLLNSCSYDYYKIGNNEIINKGDFVSLDDDFLCFTYDDPSLSASQGALQNGVGMFIDDSNVNESNPWIAYARLPSTISLCEVSNSDIKYVFHDTKGDHLNVYSSVIHLDDYKIFCLGGNTEAAYAYCAQYSKSNNSFVLNDSNLVNLTDTDNIYNYFSCTKLSSTSILFIYSGYRDPTDTKTYPLYGRIITINGVNIDLGQEILLCDLNYAGYWTSVYTLDSTHAIIGYKSRPGSSYATYAGIITISNGSLSLDTVNSINLSAHDTNKIYFKKISNNLIASCCRESNNNKIKLLNINGSSITLNKEFIVTSDSSASSIKGLEVDNNIISIIYIQDNTIYFKIFNLDGDELDSKSINRYSSSSATNTTNLLLVKPNTYVVSFSSNSAIKNCLISLSLVKWDGDKLTFKNNCIRKYNGSNLFGVAAESGREGDTIKVFVPQREI